MELGIIEIILMTSLVNSIIFLFLVLFTSRRKSQANLALTIFIFLSSLNFVSWIILPYLVSSYDWICFDRFPVVFFLGPLLLTFSEALFKPIPSDIRISRYLAGYIDIFLTVLLWIYIYFFSLDDKFDILYDILTLHIYEALAVCFNAYYVYRSIKLFLNGNTNHPRLRHVFVIIVLIFFLWIGSFLADVAVYPSQVPDSVFYPLWMLMVYLNLYLGYHFVLNPERSISYLTYKKEKPFPKNKDLPARLLHLMVEEKMFQNPGLTLSHISSELGVSTTLLSKILKEHFKLSYYDFINHHRVREVIKRFRAGDGQLLTIQTIAEEAGFRSKTTFTKAFKKETGMLPKVFISSLLADSGSAKR